MRHCRQQINSPWDSYKNYSENERENNINICIIITFVHTLDGRVISFSLAVIEMVFYVQ
jgi:hypothetical protein